MTQEEKEKLMYASKEDQEFYLKCVEGLPTLAGLNGSGNGSDGVPLPYGLGAHSVRCLREIVAMVQPKKILEIGFNMGWSSSLWLELVPESSVFSCDISNKHETLSAAEFLTNKYKNELRFIYFNRNEDFFDKKDEYYYDLIFIDGSHEFKDVIEDINLALELKIPYISFDDFLPEFGQVQDAIVTFGDKLEQINVNGNIVLYKNKTI